MPIVTLTSDFGQTDYYTALIKGALLCQQPGLTLVDITHNVKNYDIVQAAFILKNAYSAFPKGTIHLVSVNTFYRSDFCYLALRYDDHYFIGPDNGVFSLLFGNPSNDIYELEYDIADETLPVKMVFAQAVKHILGGMPFNEIGIPVESIEQRITFQPVTTATQIRGSVIHVDNYQNVITNITKSLFSQIGKNRPFSISFRRHEPISKISANYADVPVGEPLCWFNSADNLEIAINMGRASELLGLDVDHQVQIDFFG